MNIFYSLSFLEDLGPPPIHAWMPLCKFSPSRFAIHLKRGLSEETIDDSMFCAGYPDSCVGDSGIVYHLQNVSGNFGWKVIGRRLFGSSEWKISGDNGTSEKVVLFSRTECSNGNGPFAASGHMVQNPPCWRASCPLSRTKRLHQDKFAFSLFWMSQCVACSPAWRILYHVTASCKGPIHVPFRQPHL